jgi:uncharacterized protein YjiS (DUF1127 family)
MDMTIQLHEWPSSSSMRQSALCDLELLWRRAFMASRRLWRAYLDHQARRAIRLALRALDERTLRDIGVSREQIVCVANEFSRSTRLSVR